MDQLLAHISSGPQALDRALACDVEALSAAELVEVTRTCTEITRKAEALRLKALAAADRQSAHRTTDAPSLTALVAREAGVSRKEAAQQVRLANELQEAPVLRAAIADPGMSPSKARIVIGALADLPADLTGEQREQIESDLTTAARVMTAEQLGRKAKRAVEVIDRERADRLENDRLEREESAQRRAAEFWIAATPDEHTGLVSFGGKTDPVTADMLRAVVESKTSPRHRNQQTEDSRLTPPQRNGRAFTEIVRHLPRDGYGNHGGVAATLVVTVDESTLRGQTDRAGLTEFGTPVSAGQLRRMACDAGILPVVMNGASQVLDEGRTKRHHTAAQRTALAQRDRGCAYPGCDRPPGWTEAHHVIPWSRGGPTTVDDGVLLCSHHHHHVHATDTPIRITDAGAEFRVGGHWRRNERYQPLAA